VSVPTTFAINTEVPVFLRLIDTFGNPFANTAVTYETTGPTWTFNMPSTLDPNGEASGTFSTPDAGFPILVVQIPSRGFNLQVAVTVTSSLLEADELTDSRP
jgi:hypothetical protein